VVDSMDRRRSFCAIFASAALSAMSGVLSCRGRERNRPRSGGSRVKLASDAVPFVPRR
jgi:hypothetical protein